MFSFFIIINAEEKAAPLALVVRKKKAKAGTGVGAMCSTAEAGVKGLSG